MTTVLRKDNADKLARDVILLYASKWWWRTIIQLPTSYRNNYKLTHLFSIPTICNNKHILCFINSP